MQVLTGSFFSRVPLWIKRVGFKKTAVNLHSVAATKISKHLTLRKLPEDLGSKEDNALVLIFDWLYAKPAAIEKYCKLYHDIGLDVLTVRGQLKHFLWPPFGVKLSEEIFNYLLTDRCNKKYFVHAFSVGAYNYTICLKQSYENSEKYGWFHKRVIGQIYDSIVMGTYEHMSTGIATAVLPGTPTTKRAILSVLNAYYDMTRKTTRDQYDALYTFVREHPTVVPTLLLYSLDDPMCDKEMINSMLAMWRKRLPEEYLDVHFWEKSVHAAHLKFHKAEYLQAWKNLMTKVNFLPK
ncbi:hypothetical protein CHS0354_013347 [Potamilus streckersoni]|uniref:Uncharacterized protein n=1 Tax=Potamilus streckersoni TaxID=2493646 RepID=A0AAE0W516_9BIVA|nr:hypothetical protein CHS0354_013347 [Potamilus streckersoni]